MSETPTQFWTPLLRPGRYRLSNGRTVRYTPADCRNAVEQGNRMRSAGLRAPVCWMHDPAAEPAYLSATKAPGAPDAWLARGYIGEPVKFRLARDGTCEGLVRFHDPKDAEQFRRVGGVSPRVDFDWTDERGKLWPGCTISHVAVTPRPIQRDLGKPAPAYPPHYLAHASAGRSRATHYLGHATRVEGPDMADKPDETPEPEAEPTPETPEPEAPEGGEVTTPENVSDPTPAEACELLKAAGIHLGDPKTWAEFVTALKAAIHTKHGPEGGDQPLDGQPGDGTDNGGTQPAPMPPALMSHFTAAAKLKGDELEAEIRNLFKSGRIDGPTRDKRLAELKRADLSHASFAPDGALKPFDLLVKISAYKDLPPGRFAKPPGKKPGDLSHTATVDPPAELVGGGDDDIKRANDEAIERAKKLSVSR